MAEAPANLDEMLRDVHLPALLTALVHATGDDSWLRPEWKPTYVPMARGDIGIAEPVQAQMRAAAAQAIRGFLNTGTPVMPSPDMALLRRQMDFVAGAAIPPQYTDFLLDELALSGKSSKDPQFEQPKLVEAARKLSVLVIGAGMSGLLSGIRLAQAGVPFEIVDKNADVGGTWFENTYPGCRVDNSNHMYSYSFEPNHAWPQHHSPQPVLLKYFQGVADKYDLGRKSASKRGLKPWFGTRAKGSGEPL